MKRWFINLQTREKLLLGFGGVTLIMGLIILLSLNVILDLRDGQRRIEEIELANVIDYLTLESNINENRVNLLLLMNARDPDLRKRLFEEITATKSETDEVMKRLNARVNRDPIPPEKLKALDAARTGFNQVRDEITIPLIMKGDIKGAEESMFRAGAEQYAKVKALTGEMSGMAAAFARTAVAGSVRKVNDAFVALCVAGVIALLIAVFMALWTGGTIAGPLRDVTGAAMKISEGDLDVDIRADERTDEVGLLNQAFSRMAQYLKTLSATCEKIADGDLTFRVKPQSQKDTLAISFGLMTENLQGLAREMKGGAAELGDLSVNLAGLINEVIAVSADMEAIDRKVRALLQDAGEKFCASPETRAWIAELEQAMEKIHATGRSYADRSIEGQKIALAIEELGTKLNALVAPLKV